MTSTVAAHLVLWVGLVLVAVTSPLIARVAYRTTAAPVEVFQVVLAMWDSLPVAAALVIAGRSATLRLAGVLGGAVVLLGEVVLNVVQFGRPASVLVDALVVAGLGSWIVARRHASWGLLALVPAAVLAHLWFASAARDAVRAVPYEHGFPSWAVYLWGDLPVLVLAVLGLVSSFLRPRPSPDRDGTGPAVAAVLAGVAVVAGVVAFVL